MSQPSFSDIAGRAEVSFTSGANIADVTGIDTGAINTDQRAYVFVGWFDSPPTFPRTIQRCSWNSSTTELTFTQLAGTLVDDDNAHIIVLEMRSGETGTDEWPGAGSHTINVQCNENSSVDMVIGVVIVHDSEDSQASSAGSGTIGTTADLSDSVTTALDEALLAFCQYFNSTVSEDTSPQDTIIDGASLDQTSVDESIVVWTNVGTATSNQFIDLSKTGSDPWACFAISVPGLASAAVYPLEIFSRNRRQARLPNLAA